MRILRLTLKKRWFDMIKAGEKPEEYREIKEYWKVRLLALIGRTCQFWGEGERLPIPKEYFLPFDAVEFINGYSHFSPRFTIECLGIEIREGKPEWGAEPGKKYFVIKLGKLITAVEQKDQCHG